MDPEELSIWELTLRRTNSGEIEEEIIPEERDCPPPETIQLVNELLETNIRPDPNDRCQSSTMTLKNNKLPQKYEDFSLQTAFEFKAEEIKEFLNTVTNGNNSGDLGEPQKKELNKLWEGVLGPYFRGKRSCKRAVLAKLKEPLPQPNTGKGKVKRARQPKVIRTDFYAAIYTEPEVKIPIHTILCAISAVLTIVLPFPDTNCKDYHSYAFCVVAMFGKWCHTLLGRDMPWMLCMMYGTGSTTAFSPRSPGLSESPKSCRSLLNHPELSESSKSSKSSPSSSLRAGSLSSILSPTPSTSIYQSNTSSLVFWSLGASKIGRMPEEVKETWREARSGWMRNAIGEYKGQPRDHAPGSLEALAEHIKEDPNKRSTINQIGSQFGASGHEHPVLWKFGSCAETIPLGVIAKTCTSKAVSVALKPETIIKKIKGISDENKIMLKEDNSLDPEHPCNNCRWLFLELEVICKITVRYNRNSNSRPLSETEQSPVENAHGVAGGWGA